MFTDIKLKNYKSLINTEVDFSEKRNEPKPIILIYGENGIGKSDFASAFLTLCDSLQTMSARKAIQQFLEKKSSLDDIPEDTLLKVISESLKDTASIIKNCRTKNSRENMVLEFGFVIDGDCGRYLLEYDETKIVREKLDFVLNKNKTNFYDITDEHIRLNDKLFSDMEYAREFRQLLKQYQGKHSLLSVLLFEIEEKADGYTESKISHRLACVLKSFVTMSVKIKSGKKKNQGIIGVSKKILTQLEQGEIDIREEGELSRAEELLSEFFSRVYSDIKYAYYKKEYKDDKIEYQLIFRKVIYGTAMDIEAEHESAGTLHLLDVLPFLLMAVHGETVIIDELDTGIHDLLVYHILNSMLDSVKGQLIITTHNTMLLETEINPAYIYTFMADRDANKSLLPITYYEDRRHPNLNYRNRYLKGMYGGVPSSMDIDFEELWEILE